MKTAKTLLEPFFIKEGRMKKMMALTSIRKTSKVMKLLPKRTSLKHLKNKIKFNKMMMTRKLMNFKKLK